MDAQNYLKMLNWEWGYVYIFTRPGLYLTKTTRETKRHVAPQHGAQC